MAKLSQKTILLLVIILGLHLFFRTYHFQQFLGYGHDEDLGGWIAKDILVNHHWRLIGQETSITRVYIGPTFYYLQAIFFKLFAMDPIGGYFLVLAISVGTLLSFLYCFSKLFGLKVGLITSLIYACSFTLMTSDTWVVPTQPTLIWCVWYLYALFRLFEGKYKTIVLIGLLFGLIWHIHVAFIPLVLLFPLALFLAKNKQLWKKTFLSRYSLMAGLIFVILISPFVAFELRHNFIETQGFLTASVQDQHQITGLARLDKITVGVGLNVATIFYDFQPAKFAQQSWLIVLTILILIGAFIYSSNSLGQRGWIIGGWFGLVILSQFISKRAISEYYFTNLVIPTILIIGLGLEKVSHHKKYWVIGLLAIFVGINLWQVVTRPADGEGYLARKQLVADITADSLKHGYPCVAINYITTPGKGAGYRYFFWLDNLQVITPGNDVPVYSIVDPLILSPNEITNQHGVLGLITPKNPITDPEACSAPSRQLLELNGFTN